MSYIIRELLARDIDADSFFATLSNLKPIEKINASLARKIFTDCEAKGIITLVAESDEKIIGTVRILFEPKYYHGGRLAGHIEDVATHKDYIGKGVASTLIKYAIDLCRQKDCYKIILNCSDELNGFYQKLGFRHSDNCLRLDI